MVKLNLTNKKEDINAFAQRLLTELHQSGNVDNVTNEKVGDDCSAVDFCFTNEGYPVAVRILVRTHDCHPIMLTMGAELVIPAYDSCLEWENEYNRKYAPASCAEITDDDCAVISVNLRGYRNSASVKSATIAKYASIAAEAFDDLMNRCFVDFENAEVQFPLMYNEEIDEAVERIQIWFGHEYPGCKCGKYAISSEWYYGQICNIATFPMLMFGMDINLSIAYGEEGELVDVFFTPAEKVDINAQVLKAVKEHNEAEIHYTTACITGDTVEFHAGAEPLIDSFCMLLDSASDTFEKILPAEEKVEKAEKTEKTAKSGKNEKTGKEEKKEKEGKEEKK